MTYKKRRERHPTERTETARERRQVAACGASAFSRQKRTSLSLLLATALTMPALGQAQSVWTGAVSDDWFDPANWSAGVPDALVDAQINQTATAPAIEGGDAVTRSLTLGEVGGTTGGLTIENGGTLGSEAASIGHNAATDYTVTVIGPTSSWQSIAPTLGLAVGYHGTGRLHVLNGADVVSNTSMIGVEDDGEGYVLVDGVDSTWTMTPAGTETLFLGVAGHGELVVSGGGFVASGAGVIGFANTGTGIATITGAGSEWHMTAGLTVGGNGEGRLSVLDGAVVNSGAAAIGGNSGSEGFVLVSGTNSGWDINGTLDIASFGDPSSQTTGQLTIADGGTVSVNGGAGDVRIALVDDYTSGTINIGAASAGPAAAPGTLNAALIDFNQGGELVFNHTGAAYSFSPNLRSDFGAAIRHLAGTTIYTGDASQFIGDIFISGGTLLVNGTLGHPISEAEVSGGATLGGGGALLGNVSVSDGILAPGNSVGVLTIGGDLNLSASSVLEFELGNPAGAPGVDSDLIDVADSLTLDGTLNVIDAGGFGAGTYRLFDYDTAGFGGVLTDNGLAIGSVPASFTASDLSVLTSTVGQVDLLVGVSSAGFAFWDGPDTTGNGVVEGGAGTWSATRTNWTDSAGSANGAYDSSTFLIFQGAGGSVLVDNSAGPVSVANGMQFSVSGYSVVGGEITLPGATTIRVGDGTNASEGDVAIIGSNLVGSGSLEKDDFGILTLTGTNSYTGGTLVSGGTLFGSATSLQGNIVNDAELVFGQQIADGAYAGMLSGNGALRKTGDYALTLSGNSSAYAGTTDILAGSLLLDGELGGALAVRSNARLGGNGSGGAVTVNSGGTLAPGSSTGVLNVANATFDAGSIYEVELNDGGTAAGANNDLLAASGAVAINGGNVHVTPENGTDDGTTYAIGSQYTIITAGGGVSGTFASLTDDFAFLDFALSYDASSVYLLSELTIASFCLDSMTANQCAAGDGVFSTISGSLFTAALNLSDSEAPGAFDQVSGEVHASAKVALIEDSRFPREAAMGRLHSAFETVAVGGNRMETREAGIFAVWGQAYGAWGKWDGSRNVGDFGRSISGSFLGADTLLTDNLRLGVLGGYGRSSFSLGDRFSSGTDKALHLGTYVGAELGPVGLRVGGAYAWHDIDIDRSVSFTGFSDDLSSSYDARTRQIFGEAGYRFDRGEAHFEPFASIARVDLDVDGYAETGGPAALRSASQETSVTFTTTGLRAGMAVGIGGNPGRLTGMAGWRHAHGDVTPTAMHAFAGGDAFTVTGTPITRNAFVLNLGAQLELAPNAMFDFSYGGQFGSLMTDHSLEAHLAMRF